MNKSECKKYIKKAYNNIKEQNKSITLNNLENEMKKELNNDCKIYIAYSKMALYTLLKSATDITVKELSNEIDVIVRLYDKDCIINKTKNIK